MKKTRGALCGVVGRSQKIEIQTADGPIFVEIFEDPKRSGENRFPVRIEAPLAFQIIFPHARRRD